MQVSKFINKISLKKNESSLLTEGNLFYSLKSGKVTLSIVQLDNAGNILKEVQISRNLPVFFSLAVVQFEEYTYTLKIKAEEDSEINIISLNETDKKSELEELINNSLKKDILFWIENFVRVFDSNERKVEHLKKNLSIDGLLNYNSNLLGKVISHCFKPRRSSKKEMTLSRGQTKLLLDMNELYYIRSGKVRFFSVKLDENLNIIDKCEITYTNKLFFSLGAQQIDKQIYSLQIEAVDEVKLQLMYLDDVSNKQRLNEFVKTELKADVINWIEDFAGTFDADEAKLNAMCNNISLDILLDYLPELLHNIREYYFPEIMHLGQEELSSIEESEENDITSPSATSELGDDLSDFDFSAFLEQMQKESADLKSKSGLSDKSEDNALADLNLESLLNLSDPDKQLPAKKSSDATSMSVQETSPAKEPAPPFPMPDGNSGGPGMDMASLMQLMGGPPSAPKGPMGGGMPFGMPGGGGGGMPGLDMASLLQMAGGGGGMPQNDSKKGISLKGKVRVKKELSDEETAIRKQAGEKILKELQESVEEKSSKDIGSYIAKITLAENEHISLHENDKLWSIGSGAVKLFVQKLDEYGKQVERFPIPCGDIPLFFSLGMEESADGFFYVLEAVAEEISELFTLSFSDVEDKKELSEVLNDEIKEDILTWLKEFAGLFETDADLIRSLYDRITPDELSRYNSKLLGKIMAFYDMGDGSSDTSGEETEENEFVKPVSLKANERVSLLETDRMWFVKDGEVNLFLIKTDTNDEVLDRLPVPFDNLKLFFSLGKLEVEGSNYHLELSVNKKTEVDTIYFNEVEDKALLDNFIKTSVRNEILMWILTLSKLFRADIATTDNLCANLSLENLLAFNSRVLPQLEAYYQRERKSERKRRKDKAVRDQEKYSESFYNLTERLISGKAREAFYDMNVEGKSSNLVYKACIKVFKSKKIKIKEPKSAREENVTNEEIVNDIANASSVQYRTVKLENNWHLKSGGSMLCFRKSDRAPLAMIQVMSSRYKVYDPKNNKTTMVTDAIAKDVEKDAITFYKALPNRPMKLWDVISFIFETASKKDFVVVILLGLFGGLLNLITPMMTRQIVDDIVPSADNVSLIYVAGLLVLLGFTQFCFGLTESFASMRFETMSEVELTAGIWDRLINLPVRFIKQWPAGEVMGKISGITQIRNALSSIVVNTFISGVFSISYFILMFTYSWQLSLIGVGMVAILVITSLSLTKMQLKYSGKLIDLNNKIQGMLYGWVAGIPKVKIAGAERRVFHNWTKIYGEILKYTIKRTNVSNVSMVFNSTIQIITSMVLFFTMCKLTYKGLTVGEFVAFNSAFGSLSANVLNLCGTIITVNFIIPIYGRLRPFLENVPEYEDNMEDPGEITGDITFKNVTFSYSYAEKRTIEGLSFHIKPGEYVGIVGPSGAGKSTLVKLLIGFNRPSFGEINYDGMSLDKVDKRAIRRQLGVVLQESSLMAGSIFDNIAGVNMKLSQDEAWEAARKAGLDKDIKKMPMGLQTPILEGGSTLSGGQRQRILIARALASSPKVFIFDEATSALDNRTQDIVTESIGRLGVTRIIIAHRLSTVINCDKILVMDSGRIVEEGDYKTLMNNKGLFYQMAEKQMADTE